jgi:hypothetical protein
MRGRFACSTEFSASTSELRSRVYDIEDNYRIIHEEITSNVGEDYIRRAA